MTARSLQPANDPLDRVPFYVSSDGQIGPDPLALAGDHPRFSLRKLACYLAQPVLIGEFLPDCPWVGVSRTRFPFFWPEKQRDSHNFVKLFQQSISACARDASTIAIALSGGLDSLAVLWHTSLLCERDGRRFLAVTADLQDDHGHSSFAITRRLLDVLHLECELISIGSLTNLSMFPEPRWHPSGPRNDAMPRLNRAMADAARERGADVLLSGNGADELLVH